MAFGRTRAGQNVPRRDRNYTLQGRLPPCPTCHAAMMRAAGDTNSTVNYQWEQPAGTMNQVTYRGNANGSCRVTGSGAAGEAIVAGYDHQMMPAANPRAATTQGYYGVSFSGQSDQTYQNVKNMGRAGR